MPSPYRRPPSAAPIPDEPASSARWDDLILAGLMLVLAVPRVAYALATHETFGAETTIAAVAVALGLLLLVTRARS